MGKWKSYNSEQKSSSLRSLRSVTMLCQHQGSSSVCRTAVKYNLKEGFNPGTPLSQRLHANGLVQKAQESKGPNLPIH